MWCEIYNKIDARIYNFGCKTFRYKTCDNVKYAMVWFSDDTSGVNVFSFPLVHVRLRVRTLSASKTSHTRHTRQNSSVSKFTMETKSCEEISLKWTLREFFKLVPLQYQASVLLNVAYVDHVWD